MTNYAPDARKPKGIIPNTNIPLAEVLFDAKTRRFVVATTHEHKPGDYDSIRNRRKNFPDLDPLPNADGKFKGKEHKLLAKPPKGCGKYKATADEVSKSCMDLAIDG